MLTPGQVIGSVTQNIMDGVKGEFQTVAHVPLFTNLNDGTGVPLVVDWVLTEFRAGRGAA